MGLNFFVREWCDIKQFLLVLINCTWSGKDYRWQGVAVFWSCNREFVNMHISAPVFWEDIVHLFLLLVRNGHKQLILFLYPSV